MNNATASCASALALAAAADLQDNLLTATNDLERLQTLLDTSHEALQGGFFGALQLLQDLHDAGRLDAEPLGEARAHLASAVKALQFQDMATQLIAHTSRRLHNCADQMARDAFADDDMAMFEEAPLRPNPVTQSEMDTGFIELF
jgi:hypothetical protein